MNLYKTIPSIQLLITLSIVVIAPLMSFTKQSRAINIDTSSKRDSDPASKRDSQQLLAGKLKFNQPIFPKTTFGTNKFKLTDTLKKNPGAGITGKLQEQVSAYNNLFREISGDMKKKLESPFNLTDGSISLLGLSSNLNNDSLFQNNYNLFDANIGGSVLGIPFAALYQNHYYPFIPEGNQNRLSFRYDRNAYVDQIKKKLAGKFNPEEFLQNAGDPAQMLKAAAEKALRSELNNIKEQYKGLLDDKVNKLGKLEDLFSKDINAVRQLLVNNKWLEQLQNHSAMLGQLQNQINTGQPIDTQQYNFLKAELEKYKGTQNLVKILETHNKKWQESGLLKRIKESGLFKQELINKIANDPSIIRKMAKQKLDLNSLQRLFLSITKLNAGQTTADFSRLLTGNSLLHGVNAGFLLNNKKSIDLLAGKLKTYNSLLDLPFTNNIFNNNSKMLGLRLENGAQGGSNSSLSLLAYQTFEGSQFPFNVASLPRRSMVIGISRRIEINKTNTIEAELSKSSGYYSNELTGDPTDSRRNTKDLLNTQDLGKSIAASVNYNGEFEKIDMQAETFIRYAGINYDNPATSFVPAGTKEAGAGIRKLFFSKKLQVYARTNWRQYKFSETSDNQWRNSNHFMDVKWRMNKGQSVSLRYQPVRSVRVVNGIKSVNASTERLAATANIAARIRSLQYRNYVTLGWQKNIYAYQNAGVGSNRSLQVSSMQSFVIGKNVFYSNTSFNKVNNASAFIFFNTSFNTDLGITYAIGKNLSASSSVNYNSIQGWYQQVAVKQSLAGELGKKIKMDIYVDIGKNIKTFQPLPFSLFRAEWSVQYMFNR